MWRHWSREPITTLSGPSISMFRVIQTDYHAGWIFKPHRPSAGTVINRYLETLRSRRATVRGRIKETACFAPCRCKDDLLRTCAHAAAAMQSSRRSECSGVVHSQSTSLRIYSTDVAYTKQFTLFHSYKSLHGDVSCISRLGPIV